jgi:plasmid stabilization system protein ParE
MTYALRFLPQVETDVLNGRTWYESKAPGLGEEFLRVFYASAEELARDPQVYPKVHGDFRRRLLRRFPYAIYFRIQGEYVVVFGLFHCARDPRRLRRDLGKRR